VIKVQVVAVLFSAVLHPLEVVPEVVVMIIVVALTALAPMVDRAAVLVAAQTATIVLALGIHLPSVRHKEVMVEQT
jgi:hypothetical protein